MMCTKMVPNEEDQVEKFIGGLLDNIQGNMIARGQQPPFKRQNTEVKMLLEPIRLVPMRKRSAVAVTTQETPRPNQRVVTYFECGAQGHYQKDCPKVKNQTRGNKARVPDARGKAYVLGGGDANPGPNTVTGLLGHPFNIDLMPIDLVSFDVIIGMDWLVKNHDVIVCDEKIVRIPYENEF
nr:reverse transcriptase domain-containing protein [Tanacetum cinerariifolium]